mmetsp:Transcript_14279/g.29067  ORF Transcript_14279/g.29067 Transcript_14279/m.29067 type:complete len:717 (+) Transcript_14279:104-2254(+)
MNLLIAPITMAAMGANVIMAATAGCGVKPARVAASISSYFVQPGVQIARNVGLVNSPRISSVFDSNIGDVVRTSVMAFTTLTPGSKFSHDLGTLKQKNFQHRTFPAIRPLSSSFGEAQEAEQTTNRVDTSAIGSGDFYAHPETFPDFASLGITSPILLKRLSSLGLTRPSAVQAAVFSTISKGEDVIIGSETGSGKTLAYLAPLVDDILRRKREWKEKRQRDMEEEGGGYLNYDDDAVMDPGYDYARAIVLVPNKELANQAVRMAASIGGGLDRCVIWGAEGILSGGTSNNHTHFSQGEVPEEEIVRIAILPGGLSAPQDFPPFRHAAGNGRSKTRQPPPDLVFTTPANLGPMGLSPKNIEFFADVPTLVVDEADMLLDGGYVRQLNNALMGFRRADRMVERYGDITFQRKDDSGNDEQDDFFHDYEEEETKGTKTQHIFVAATIPDYGLRSVDAYLNRKFPKAKSITMAGMHNARHYGLETESNTMWNEIVENKDRMKRLVDLLRLERTEVGVDGRGLKGEKVMMFLNNSKDVDGATNGLRRAGINAVPFHAKIPLEERSSNLDKFRRYIPPSKYTNEADEKNMVLRNDSDAVPVLVCTDLASRGLDIPAVTAIVQLQFATNVVAHLHRMGRCGRAGNRDGRGIVFYGPEQRELVEVVRDAEQQQTRMLLSQDVEEEMGDEDIVGGKTEVGKVKKAFSRKRGFTKKRKKEKRKAE